MTVTRYQAGAAIPDHILDVEPIGPSGPRPALTFGSLTDVCDAGDRFILITRDPEWSGPVAEIAGDHGHVSVFAPTKEVVLVLATQHILPPGDDDGDRSPVRPVVPGVAA